MGVKIRCPEHRPAEFKAGNWWALIDKNWPLKCACCEGRATAAYYIEDEDEGQEAKDASGHG